MFSFQFRKTSAEDYQRRLPRTRHRNRYVSCGHRLRCMWAAVPFNVGTDYAMWALITVNPIFMPTSQRNRCPHPTVFGAHIHWNHLPTSTGIRKFGEDVSEQLERIPATYKVIRHVRPKFACAGCERVVEAPAPARPIERGLPGPALLAHVLVSKYGDHSPLYRQSEIYAREGVDLDRSTLAGWVGPARELLAPLVDEIRKHVMAAAKIHADDTPVPVLAPGNGKTKTGRLWTYVRDDRPAGYPTAPAVWFAYSEDRKGEHPRRHLKDFRGALQADAYAGFQFTDVQRTSGGRQSSRYLSHSGGL
jgi:transposase